MGRMISTAEFIEAHRLSDDATLAAALVTHAGQLALRMRDAGLTTDYKTSVSDVVTEADRTAEAFVAEVLEALRSEDGVLGEEGASRTSSTGRTWVIDPVDGTYNFSRGSDYFCSALALADGNGDGTEDGNVLVAAVHRPALDTTWLANAGELRINGERQGGVSAASLSNEALLTYLHPTFMRDDAVRGAWLRAVRDAATVRMCGAGSVDLATIAAGQAGAWLQHSVADWDWLPGKALVEAAGGLARKVDAGGVTWCVAGGTQIVEEITSRLMSHE